MTRHYETRLAWRGATSGYEHYTRRWTVDLPGKPSLYGSADPHFRGDAALHNIGSSPSDGSVAKRRGEYWWRRRRSIDSSLRCARNGTAPRGIRYCGGLAG